MAQVDGYFDTIFLISDKSFHGNDLLFQQKDQIQYGILIFGCFFGFTRTAVTGVFNFGYLLDS
jgi:hypothetical protein